MWAFPACQRLAGEEEKDEKKEEDKRGSKVEEMNVFPLSKSCIF